MSKNECRDSILLDPPPMRQRKTNSTFEIGGVLHRQPQIFSMVLGNGAQEGHRFNYLSILGSEFVLRIVSVLEKLHSRQSALMPYEEKVSED